VCGRRVMHRIYTVYPLFSDRAVFSIAHCDHSAQVPQVPCVWAWRR
jgi:hypothetical protein